MMNVPFFDLKKQNEHLKPVLDSAIKSVFAGGMFVGGPIVEHFELNLAEYYGSGFAAGVGNGTDALSIALHMLGIGDGDEVITSSYSYIGTANAIHAVGAKPVFVDIHPEYYTLDLDQVEEKISSKTKAIVPVHLYGQMADMERVRELSQKHGLQVVEDAAQAHGASQRGIRPAWFSDAACFSFYPTKQHGALGDGGAILSSDKKFIQACRTFSHNGGHKLEYRGVNSRLDPLQCAILEAKLKFLNNWIEGRNEVASRYREGLGDIQSLALPGVMEGNRHSFYNYVVQVDQPDDLAVYLRMHGIGTKRNYEYVIPHTHLYPDKGNYPVAEQLAKRGIALPMYPEMDGHQVDYVIKTLTNFYS